jgi:hypothetical protein
MFDGHDVNAASGQIPAMSILSYLFKCAAKGSGVPPPSALLSLSSSSAADALAGGRRRAGVGCYAVA